MKLFSKTMTPILHLQSKFINFVKNSQAVAAVEFALIAPILLILFIGTVEISLVVAVDRKMSRTSSAVADLVAQSADFTTPAGQDELEAIFGVAERIMYPYKDRLPCVVISVVEANAEADTNGDGTIDNDDDVIAKVTGSVDNKTPSVEYTSPPAGQCNKSSSGLGPDELARQKRIVGDVFTLPDAINVDGSILVVAEIEYDHKPVVGFINADGVAGVKFEKAAITLGDRIYLRPRKATVTLPN